jgi:transportin-1
VCSILKISRLFYVLIYQGLFTLASDPDATVRKCVCQAFVLLCDVRMSVLVPQLENIMKFMLVCTQQEDDEALALEACEFWATYCGVKVCV